MTRNPILMILIILLLKDQFEPAASNQPALNAVSPLRIESILDNLVQIGTMLSKVGSLSSIAKELPAPEPSLLEGIDMSKLMEMAGPIMKVLSNN